MSTDIGGTDCYPLSKLHHPERLPKKVFANSSVDLRVRLIWLFVHPWLLACTGSYSPSTISYHCPKGLNTCSEARGEKKASVRSHEWGYTSASYTEVNSQQRRTTPPTPRAIGRDTQQANLKLNFNSEVILRFCCVNVVVNRRCHKWRSWGNSAALHLSSLLILLSSPCFLCGRD